MRALARGRTSPQCNVGNARPPPLIDTLIRQAVVAVAAAAALISARQFQLAAQTHWIQRHRIGSIRPMQLAPTLCWRHPLSSLRLACGCGGQQCGQTALALALALILILVRPSTSSKPREQLGEREIIRSSRRYWAKQSEKKIVCARGKNAPPPPDPVTCAPPTSTSTFTYRSTRPDCCGTPHVNSIPPVWPAGRPNRTAAPAQTLH